METSPGLFPAYEKAAKVKSTLVLHPADRDLRDGPAIWSLAWARQDLVMFGAAMWCGHIPRLHPPSHTTPELAVPSVVSFHGAQPMASAHLGR